MTWQPMDTAPKDGTNIDLWVVRTRATLKGSQKSEYRVCDVRWVGKDEGPQIGHWRRRRHRDEHDDDEWLSVEFESETNIIRATWWMLVEPPPV